MADAGLDRIGKYEIQAELGRGGFGRVFRAFDPTVGRLVAVKILTAEGSKDLLTRFRNEAAAAGSLHHKNIVTIYEFGEHQGLPFIAMEFLEGEDLQHVIASRRSLTLLDKVSIMSQVAEGLYCAHHNGIVHRDVKPANIRLLPDGTVKIMDFGIARLVHDTLSTRLTRQGHVIGTLLYMAPEQVLGAEIDTLCDIFAYGITYYELLTGKHPFQAADPRAVFYKITSEDPEPLRHTAPDCPEALEQLVFRTLHKEREFRYQNLRDLQLDAEPILIELRQQRAAALLGEVDQRMAAGDLDGAQTLLTEAADLDPANRKVRQLRETVQTELRRRRLQPRIDALAVTSRTAIAEGRYTEAVEALETAVKLDRENLEVQNKLEEARTLLERSRRAARRLAEARDAFTQQNLSGAFQQASEAIELDPHCGGARQFLEAVQREIEQRENRRKLEEKLREARELLLVGSFDAAESVLEGLAADQKTASEAQELRARIDAQRVQSKRQERLNAGLAATRELLEQSRLADAVALLQRVKAEFPEDAQVSALLVDARQKLAAFERAQAVDRARGEILALAEAREFDRALDALAHALDTFAGESSLVRLRDSIATARSKWERARMVEETGRACASLRDQTRFAEAVEAADRALRQYPDDPALLDLRRQIAAEWEAHRREESVRRTCAQARALLAHGDPGQAAAILEAAYAAIPEEPALTAELARAREALRAKQRADGIQKASADAGGLCDAREFGRALGVLDAARAEYGDDAGLTALRQRIEAIREALEKAEPLAAERPAAAVEVLREAEAKYPGAAVLEAARSRAEGLLRASERSAAVRKAADEARRLLEAGEFGRAFAVLDAARAEHGDDPRLAAVREQIQGIREAIQRAESLIEGRPGDAVAVLREAEAKYPGAALLAGTRSQAEEALRAKQRAKAIEEVADEARRLCDGRDFERSLALLDAALAEHGGEPGLAALRLRVEGIRDALQQIEPLIPERPEQAIEIARAAEARHPGAGVLAAARTRAEEALRVKQESDAIRAAAVEARGALEQRRFEPALRIVTAALKAHAADAGLQQLAAEIRTARDRERSIQEALDRCERLRAKQRFSEALQGARDAIGKHPGERRLVEMARALEQDFENQSVADTARRAESLFAENQFQQAAELTAAALEAYPDRAPLRELDQLIRAAWERQKRAEGVEQAAREARAHASARRFQPALETLEDALRQYPGEEPLLRLRESVLAARAGWERGRAVEQTVRDCEASFAAGKLADAGRAVETGLQAFPGEPALIALQKRLQIEQERKRREEAVRRAIADADVHLQQRDPGSAVHLLEAAATQCPNEPALVAALARAHDALDKQRRAEAVEEVCRETRLLVEAKDFDRALRTVKQSLKRFSGEHRLRRLQESVLAQRSEWERQRIRTEKARAASAHQSAQAVTDEVQIPSEPVAAPAPSAPPAPAPRTAAPKRRRVAIAAGLVAIAGVSAGLWRYQSRSARIAFPIVTEPEGATVRVNGAECRTPGCRLQLPPGRYRVEVELEGYEPQVVTAWIDPHNPAPAPFHVSLQPAPTRVQISTNFAQGRATLDGVAVGAHQSGDLVSEGIAPGRHQLVISGPDGEASVPFTTAAAKLPALSGPIRAQGMGALVLANLGRQARLIATGGAGTVILDGKPAGDLRDGGIDLSGLAEGAHELVLNGASGRRSLQFRAGKMPSVSVSLSSERSFGTLVVETGGQDGASVFIDGRRSQHPTRGGRLRVEVEAASHSIRVEKPGYRTQPPELTASVKRGEEARAVFALQPEPSLLVIAGALPDTIVTVDGQPSGPVRPDGGLTIPLPPGPHKIGLAKQGRVPLALERSFTPGGTVRLEARETQLAPAPVAAAPTPHPAKPVIEPPPAPAAPSPAVIEAQDWEKARASRNAGAIQAFLRRYPGSQHGDEAQRLLEQLDWDATSKTDRSALQGFLARHPGGVLAAQATGELARIDAESRRGQELDRVAGERAAIRQVLANLSAAYGRKDADQFASLWRNYSQKNLRELRSLFKNASSVQLDLKPTQDPAVSGDTARVTCTYSSEIRDQAGPHTVQRNVIITLVRINGRWVIDSMQ